MAIFGVLLYHGRRSRNGESRVPLRFRRVVVERYLPRGADGTDNEVAVNTEGTDHIEELVSRIDAVESALKKLASTAQAAAKAVRKVTKLQDDPVAVIQALDQATRVEELAGVADLAPDTLSHLMRDLDPIAATWRLSQIAAVKRAAEAAGLAVDRLTADEWRVGETTVVLDLEQGEARICYARELLATVRVEPDAIVKAVKKHTRALHRGDPAAQTVFEELRGAYCALIGRRGLTLGERVPIVDLLPELFVMRQSSGFWGKSDPKSPTPVSKAQLAHDLDALQRARCLQHGGWRIVLGTATGGSAARKKSVVFLETGGAGGQYFLTFTLQPSSPAGR